MTHSAISYYRQQLAPARYGRELSGIVAPDSVFNLAIATLLEQYGKAGNLF